MQDEDALVVIAMLLIIHKIPENRNSLKLTEIRSVGLELRLRGRKERVCNDVFHNLGRH